MILEALKRDEKVQKRPASRSISTVRDLKTFCACSLSNKPVCHWGLEVIANRLESLLIGSFCVPYRFNTSELRPPELLTVRRVEHHAQTPSWITARSGQAKVRTKENTHK